jgi:hypothetical protein
MSRGGNFGLGLQPLNAQEVQHLCAAAHAAGRPQSERSPVSPHIVFIADYREDCIDVSDRLPEPSRLPDVSGIPCFRSYQHTRLRVEAETPPMLPDGDLSADE